VIVVTPSSTSVPAAGDCVIAADASQVSLAVLDPATFGTAAWHVSAAADRHGARAAGGQRGVPDLRIRIARWVVPRSMDLAARIFDMFRHAPAPLPSLPAAGGVLASLPSFRWKAAGV